MGSNLGSRRKNIQEGLKLLAESGARILKVSSCYQSKPAEGVRGNQFLNGAVLIETKSEPELLLNLLQKIEEQMGRPRPPRQKEARTLDLDILYYEDRIFQKPLLQIPHPKRLERWFVMKPAAEVAPDFYDPVLKKRLDVIASPPSCFRKKAEGCGNLRFKK